MSLRSRILLLYLALAFIPMLVVAIGNYLQSMNALRNLVHAKLDAASEQGVREIGAHEQALRSSLVTFSRSILTEPWYAAGTAERTREGEIPWRDALRVLGPSFESVELRDDRGELLARAVSPATGAGEVAAACGSGSGRPVAIGVDVINAGDAVPRGKVVGWVRADALIPEEVLRGWFGRNGQRLVVERETGGILFDARCASGMSVAARAVAADWTWSLTEPGRGRVRLAEDGIAKVGSFIEAAAAPWIVVSVADMEEFTGPYGEEQLVYLLFVMFVVVAAGGAFVILAQEVMGSLDELTVAAGRIGEGELTPWLPPPGPDEVGRLSHAFSIMLTRIKGMMRQNEVARRLAVAGEVASQLSHEIRNPLSSIRLNLQSLERETRTGNVPSDLPQVLRLCLREIGRLDEAVGSVLELGRPRAPEFRPCRLSEVANDSLAVVRGRLAARRVEVRLEDPGECDQVLGDEGQLRGVFLNLFLNAIDAMPSGGTLEVRTVVAGAADTPEVRVHVKDSGEGVRPELRHLVFEPFFTTRPNGSGIGLPVARQTVEAHGGRLYLAHSPGQGPGAEFVVALPAATGEAREPAGASAGTGWTMAGPRSERARA
jgi:two-component system sensor histidine kinase AtoS